MNKKSPQCLSAKDLIAPCGMNCRLCGAYQRKRNPCPGCRIEDPRKPKTRRNCRIKNCKIRPRIAGNFCADCSSFPCELLLRLDARYRANYGMSMIENLKSIKAGGLRNFVEREQGKWLCDGCGEMLCVHLRACPTCQREWR